MSTEEYREVLEGVAQKCSTDYLLLPAVPSIGNSLEEDVKTTPFEIILAEVESVSASLEGKYFCIASVVRACDFCIISLFRCLDPIN